MPNYAIEHLNENEFASFYKAYIEKVEAGDPVQLLINDLEDQLSVLENIPDEKCAYKYAEGKWTIAELIIHLCDSESVFAYRALTFSRNDKTNLPGFDQDEWVKNSNANALNKKKIIGAFKTCRNHTIALYKSFSDEQLKTRGIANDADFSVRAIAYIIIGHNRHHFDVLNKNYLIA